MPKRKPTAKTLGKLLFGRGLAIKLHVKHAEDGHREQDYITEMKALSRDVSVDGNRIPFYFSRTGKKRVSFTHLGAHCYVDNAPLRRELETNLDKGFAFETDQEFKANIRKGIEVYD